jgi:hypothetical protein
MEPNGELGLRRFGGGAHFYGATKQDQGLRADPTDQIFETNLFGEESKTVIQFSMRGARFHPSWVSRL